MWQIALILVIVAAVSAYLIRYYWRAYRSESCECSSCPARQTGCECPMPPKFGSEEQGAGSRN